MSSTYTPILVGVASPVSEILLLSKTAKFPFPNMDYSPWSSKNLIDRIQLKKFMQVGIDAKCMHTNLVGRTFPVSEIPLLSKMANFPFLTMDYSPWSSKNLINQNQLKKFMQVGIDVKCMHTDFGGQDLSSFGVVSCPAPSLEEEGSGDTRGFFVTDWNAISSEWAGFLSRNMQ